MIGNGYTAAQLLDAIRSGRTVYVATYLHCTKLDGRALARFEARGLDLLRQGRDGHPYMARGRHFDDISLCAIRIVGE